MLIVEKQGVWLHGVFGIFQDYEKQEAIAVALRCARHDSDAYHQWCVRKVTNIKNWDDAKDDALHLTIFETNKAHAQALLLQNSWNYLI